MNAHVAHVAHLDHLIRRGRDLGGALAADPAHHATLAETRIWQRDCASAISHLSGGSKAHWLARRFSEAFLVRSSGRDAIEHADMTEIVDRIVAVLNDAASAVTSTNAGESGGAIAAGDPPRIARFDFVHDAALRPILEQAALDSRRALDEGAFARAFMLSCGVLEALITDALNRAGLGPIASWSFDQRIAAAEHARLIRNGCARLPAAARRYRELADPNGDLRPDVDVSPRDARLVAQVIQVVIRDLDPGR
jgi:hypothetical protein